MNKQQKSMIHSICNNYKGYPFYNSFTRYQVLGFSMKEISTAQDSCFKEDASFSEEQKIMIIRMLSILLIEIEDWEWETVMNEPKSEYIALYHDLNGRKEKDS